MLAVKPVLNFNNYRQTPPLCNQVNFAYDGMPAPGNDLITSKP